MVKTVFGKNGKSLVFPVTCQGYVSINYNDFFSSSNDDPEHYGIYAIENEGFALEAYLTPYDTKGNPNLLGFGRTSITSSSTEAQKNSLSNLESQKVFPSMSRLLIEDGGRTAKHYLAETMKRTETQLNVAPVNMLNSLAYGRVMTIFHNKYVNVSLVNDGLNINGTLSPNLQDVDLFNPSSYRLRASIYAGGGYDTLFSDFVFEPTIGYTDTFSSPSVTANTTTHTADLERQYVGDTKEIKTEPVYYAETRYALASDKRQLKIKRSSTGVSGTWEIETNGAVTDETAKSNLQVGMELFTENGIKLGKIMDVGDLIPSGNTREFTMDDGDTENYTDDFSSSYQVVYSMPQKEALYMFNTHMVGLSFNYETGRMVLFYNGQEVATKQHKYHPDSGESEAVNENFWNFSFSPTNCYIGKNVEQETWDIPDSENNYIIDREAGISALRTQFYGELHEFAISKGFKKSFNSIQNFDGKFDNLLLYYQFDGGLEA